jgi:hypothetical protein
VTFGRTWTSSRRNSKPVRTQEKDRRLSSRFETSSEKPKYLCREDTTTRRRDPGSLIWLSTKSSVQRFTFERLILGIVGKVDYFKRQCSCIGRSWRQDVVGDVALELFHSQKSLRQNEQLGVATRCCSCINVTSCGLDFDLKCVSSQPSKMRHTVQGAASSPERADQNDLHFD